MSRKHFTFSLHLSPVIKLIFVSNIMEYLLRFSATWSRDTTTYTSVDARQMTYIETAKPTANVP